MKGVNKESKAGTRCGGDRKEEGREKWFPKRKKGPRNERKAGQWKRAEKRENLKGQKKD